MSSRAEAARASDQALATGDWIAAAMSILHLRRGYVAFNGRKYGYEINAQGNLIRLNPAIKSGAKDFGLDERQIERFYGRACKRLCRALRQGPSLLPS